MIAVVITPTANDRAAAIFLPATLRKITRGQWSFRFYRSNEATVDRDFHDPIDGALLIGYRSFRSQTDADAWVCGHAETVQ